MSPRKPGRGENDAKQGMQTWAECAYWKVETYKDGKTYLGIFDGFHRKAQYSGFALHLRTVAENNPGAAVRFTNYNEEDAGYTAVEIDPKSVLNFQAMTYFDRLRDKQGKPLERIYSKENEREAQAEQIEALEKKKLDKDEYLGLIRDKVSWFRAVPHVTNGRKGEGEKTRKIFGEVAMAEFEDAVHIAAYLTRRGFTRRKATLDELIAAQRGESDGTVTIYIQGDKAQEFDKFLAKEVGLTITQERVPEKPSAVTSGADGGPKPGKTTQHSMF